MTDKESSKNDFLSEAEELLEELTSDLQSLEDSKRQNAVRPDLINKIFREFHSLKGISGMLGFQAVSNFTHELETLLDHIRLGKLPLQEKIIDLLFQSIDTLNLMLGEIKEETSGRAEPWLMVQRIQSLLLTAMDSSESRTFPELQLDQQTLASLTEYEEHRLRENLRDRKNIFGIRLSFANSTFDQDLRDVNATLSKNGEIISTLPYFDAAFSQEQMLFQLLYGTDQALETVHRLIGRFETEIRDLRSSDGIQIAETARERQEADDSLRSISSTVRVDIQKLDEVINVIGELVISKTMISNLSRDLITAGGSAGKLGPAFTRAAAELEKKLVDLQHRIIETRLVPIGQIYHRLARMVRKISRETGKQLQIQFFGENTELDKIMIEQISDPLMHIVRNAIDHGIESVEERRKLQKTDPGNLKVSAFQRGNNVVIQVQDDGRGIQTQRVQEHARKRGLIPNDRVLNQAESLDLIFTPGFSSTEHVTEISGRGVGLDVVKKNIASLKGTIRVMTEENRGTIFEITLPITLAIIQALIVRIQETKYAVPLSSVSETVRIFARDIRTIDKKEVYYLRDKTIPLIRVDRFFHLPSSDDREKLFMILVQMAEQSFGLLVDELAGQQEIIIKSMGDKLKNIPGIAGAAEIGERKPILVLDAESMIEEATHGKIRAI
jgi:two-component system chemotaxis sensor kinase CheA